MKENRTQKLLRQAIKPVEGQPEPGRDLWPDVLRRLDAEQQTQPGAGLAAPPRFNWVFFDWALLAGLLTLAGAFPASIPVLLYYL
jgi:hypothetical protein